jgi:hypothetical protein
MSLHPHVIAPVPAETARVAHAAFPKGHPVTGCVKMYGNRWFENGGSNTADQAAPASPNIDADDTQSKMAYGSI